jgi:uncharacterized membrane protein
MRPPFYLRQLKRDLDTWIAKGLVDEENKEAILASVGAGNQARTMDVILAVFGVILIGAGAMSFVAANWAAMGKLERLVVLFGSLWAAYAIAGWFLANTRGAIGQAFVLLGVILFGVNIHFVAQTYNIQAHYPDGLLLWGVGAILAAVAVPSRAALALALALGGWWTWQESQPFEYGVRAFVHTPFLVYWAVCAATAWYLNWRPGVHLSALTLLGWFVINFGAFQRLLGWGDAEVLTIYIFLPLALWSLMQLLERNDANGLALSTGHYAFFTFLVAYGALQLPDNEHQNPSSTWLAFAAIMTVVSVGAVTLGLTRKVFTVADIFGTLFACITTMAYIFMVKQYGNGLDVPYLVFALIVIIWSIQRGVRLQDRFVINWSTVAFGLWFLYCYFELFEGLLDQSIFFTVGGILLILLSLTLETVRRRLVAAAPAKEATP